MGHRVQLSQSRRLSFRQNLTWGLSWIARPTRGSSRPPRTQLELVNKCPGEAGAAGPLLCPHRGSNASSLPPHSPVGRELLGSAHIPGKENWTPLLMGRVSKNWWASVKPSPEPLRELLWALQAQLPGQMQCQPTMPADDASRGRGGHTAASGGQGGDGPWICSGLGQGTGEESIPCAQCWTFSQVPALPIPPAGSFLGSAV